MKSGCDKRHNLLACPQLAQNSSTTWSRVASLPRGRLLEVSTSDPWLPQPRLMEVARIWPQLRPINNAALQTARSLYTDDLWYAGRRGNTSPLKSLLHDTQSLLVQIARCSYAILGISYGLPHATTHRMTLALSTCCRGKGVGERNVG